jgi:hypothetical protein
MYVFVESSFEGCHIGTLSRNACPDRIFMLPLHPSEGSRALPHHPVN